MKKRVYIVLLFLSITTLSTILAHKFWIARFIVSLEIKGKGTVAKLVSKDMQDIECNCSIYLIRSPYESFKINSGEKILLLGFWEINTEEDKNITIDVWRKRVFNYTNTLVGIGRFENCDNTFENLTGIPLKYQDKSLCIYTYDSGYAKLNTVINGKSEYVVFIWIPSIMEEKNLTIGSSVYILE